MATGGSGTNRDSHGESRGDDGEVHFGVGLGAMKSCERRAVCVENAVVVVVC